LRSGAADKPSSVRVACSIRLLTGAMDGANAPERPFLYPGRCRPGARARCRTPEHPTRTHDPRTRDGRLFRALPGLCLGLHAVGFAMPRLSPAGRCALTAPFHPCLCSFEPSAVCFLLHFPSPVIAPLRGCSGGWALPTTVSFRARTFLKRAPLPACGRLAAPFNT
jgi:hypothetical protein